MAGNTSPIFTAVPVCTGVQFTSTDTTTKKTLCTGGTNGTRIESIKCCTNDTANVVLNFYISISGTDYYYGDVTVPLGSGYTTIVSTDAASVISPGSLGAILLPSGAILKAACNATMTAAKVTDVVTMGGDF